MSQPVKLSDEIVNEARQSSAIFQRSIAGQIEYWAQLGRPVEGLLDLQQTIVLRQAGVHKGVAECLAMVGTEEGKARVRAVLAARPFPQYEADPKTAGVFVRTEADGSRVKGRFLGRSFVAER